MRKENKILIMLVAGVLIVIAQYFIVAILLNLAYSIFETSIHGNVDFGRSLWIYMYYVFIWVCLIVNVLIVVIQKKKIKLIVFIIGLVLLSYYWFVLQHLRGYKPFITKITFTKEFEGSI